MIIYIYYKNNKLQVIYINPTNQHSIQLFNEDIALVLSNETQSTKQNETKENHKRNEMKRRQWKKEKLRKWQKLQNVEKQQCGIA